MSGAAYIGSTHRRDTIRAGVCARVMGSESYPPARSPPTNEQRHDRENGEQREIYGA